MIKGSLSLGALVAVLAAYKDILAPWKELLTWYSTKEDVRIKYEQIVSQFEPPGSIESKLMEDPPATVPPLAGEIAATALTYAEEGGANRVERVSFNIPAGEHVALVGGGHSGKDDLTHLLARLVFPVGGRLAIAGANFAEVHQAVPGRRMAYATQNAYIFSGTLSHNLYYGLMHQPLRPPVYDEAQAKREQARVRDALAAGNSPDDVRADWIDYAAAGVADAGAAGRGRARGAAPRGDGAGSHRLRPRERSGPAGPSVLRGDGPRGARAHPGSRPGRRSRVVRRAVRSATRYHSNISVAENLLFGTPRSPAFQPANLRRQSGVRRAAAAKSACWTTSTRRA